MERGRRCVRIEGVWGGDGCCVGADVCPLRALLRFPCFFLQGKGAGTSKGAEEGGEEEDAAGPRVKPSWVR